MMTVRLPEPFVDKMKKLLGDEYTAYIASYEQPRYYGLRVNTLKLTPEAFLACSPLAARLKPIPWAAGAYYYDEADRPGKHAHYHAGLYYIQEPSAMAPAELLDVRPGHRVLDLCAAPGGKSTQLASKLQGEGLLVTNDNATERTKALARNVELAGVRNAIVMNEEPAALAGRFSGFFDRVLVDAPCSGEGMFRKDESMIAQWEKHSVARCSAMQRDILGHAAAMVAPGGLLAYSTCTFSPEENEAQIAALLMARPDFSIEPIALSEGWVPGLTEWPAMDEQLREPSLAGTARLWPHRVEGEGHYVALLRRSAEVSAERSAEPGASLAASAASTSTKQDRSDKQGGRARNGKLKQRDSERRSGAAGKDGVDAIKMWHQYAEQTLSDTTAWPGRLIAFGARVYLQPTELPALDGLRVVRAGWYLGEATAHRFEPSQALAMGLRKSEALRTLELSSTSEEAAKYLKGETLAIVEARVEVLEGTRKGSLLVCIDGHPVGWGKWDGGMLKNGLAPGWRMA